MPWNRSTSSRARLRQAAQYHVEGLERRLFLSSAIAAFAAQQTFTAGASAAGDPVATVISDLNGDGKPDLVVADHGYPGAVSVLVGNGNCTFQPQQTFAAGKEPSSVSVSDVNADGKPDLVVANYFSGTVGVLLGNGNGTFQAQQTFGVGSNTTWVGVSDLNGDGKPVLVATNYNFSNVAVLLGNGNGTFQNDKTFAVAGVATCVAVSDLNGDGRPDLVITDRNVNSVSVLLGNGDGTFQARRDFSVGTYPESVTIADVNGDGRPDVLVANFGGTASVLLGNGNGTFQAPRILYASAHSYSIGASDVNGDGKPDLVVANVGNVGVFLGNGNGTFQTQRTFTAGANPRSVAISDLNADGRSDVVVANFGSDTAGVLLGDVPPTVLSINRTVPPGPNTVDSSVTYTVTFNEPVTGLDLTDFALTLAGGVTTTPPLVVSGSGAVYTVRVNGISGSGTLGLNLADDGGVRDSAGNPLQPGGTVAFQPRQTFTTAPNPLSVAMADVNGDGSLDSIVICGSSTASVLLGNGDGTFRSQQTFGTGPVSSSLAVADVNGDGKPDVVTVNYDNNSVTVLLGAGDGTFQVPQTVAAGLHPASIAVADLNADGRPDLVVANHGDILTNGTFGVLLGNGNGTFQSQKTVAAGKPFSLALADVNGDGKPDLIAGGSVLLGNGNGTFALRQTFYTSSALVLAVVVADFNGDGTPDIAVANGNHASKIDVLLGNGDGTFKPRQTTASFLYENSLAVSDVNGDGKPDLVVGQWGNTFYSNGVGVLLGNGNGTFQPQMGFGTGSSPLSVAAADLNGDGRVDLMTANANATISILLANAHGDFAGQVYAIAPPADSVTGTTGADTITLTKDTDGTDIDWTMGASSGVLPINDPNGLTINGNGGSDTINLDYGSGGTNNPLPNTIHLNGTFTINGLSISNPLANTNLEIGRSTVYISYSSSPLALIQGYLKNGYNYGTWNGVPTASTGVITSLPAAQNALQTAAIGYADSADGVIAGQPANTIELKYTLYGDTRLLGTVGSANFTTLTLHYHQTAGGTWDTGDFNYDGSVNFNDFTLLTRTYNTSLGLQAVPATSAPSPASSSQTNTPASRLPAVAPKPAASSAPAHHKRPTRHGKHR